MSSSIRTPAAWWIIAKARWILWSLLECSVKSWFSLTPCMGADYAERRRSIHLCIHLKCLMMVLICMPLSANKPSVFPPSVPPPHLHLLTTLTCRICLFIFLQKCRQNRKRHLHCSTQCTNQSPFTAFSVSTGKAIDNFGAQCNTSPHKRFIFCTFFCVIGVFALIRWAFATRNDIYLLEFIWRSVLFKMIMITFVGEKNVNFEIF